MTASYLKIDLHKVYPHPAIVEAVEASLTSDDAAWYRQFSDEMLKTLQEAQPAHVLQAEHAGKKYCFFAGWQLFHELRRRNIGSIYAVLHKTPPDDIEKWAVMAALGIPGLAEINSHHQSSAYLLLGTHKQLWPMIFSGDRPRTPTTALERLCGISRSAAQRVATPPRPLANLSLLEKILSNDIENRSDQRTDKRRT